MPVCGTCKLFFRFKEQEEAMDPRPPYTCYRCRDKKVTSEKPNPVRRVISAMNHSHKKAQEQNAKTMVADMQKLYDQLFLIEHAQDRDQIEAIAVKYGLTKWYDR